MFPGFPCLLRVDRESSFAADPFRDFADEKGVLLNFSVIEAHHSFGKGERYHNPLRRIYHCICRGAPTIDKETALWLALKSINDTMGRMGWSLCTLSSSSFQLMQEGTRHARPRRSVSTPWIWLWKNGGDHRGTTDPDGAAQ